MRTALLILLAAIPLHAPARAAASAHFDWRADTIAFSNDTVFAYQIDDTGRMTIHRRTTPVRFAHRCFVLTRAVLQFHKFVRFDPHLPRLDEAGYKRLLTRLWRIPAWLPARAEAGRIVIPGYANLNQFSRGKDTLMKRTMGEWFPTYLRVGNWRMVGPFPRFGQAAAYAQLVRGLNRGKLQAIYLTRFPRMNHSLVLFDYHLYGERTRFDAYDPNYPNTLSWVDYDKRRRSFDFERRWFWPGGQVNLMRVYISPIH